MKVVHRPRNSPGLGHGSLNRVDGDITSDWYRASIRTRWARRGKADSPTLTPLTRSELDARGVGRALRRDRYVRVEPGVYVPVELVREAARPHGRSIDAVTLVRAHARRCPEHVATAFGAGAMYGMRYFCDEEPLEFIAPHGTGGTKAPDHVRYRASRRLGGYRETGRRPDARLPELVCAAPEVALGHMLATLGERDDGRDQRWRVPDLRGIRAGLSPTFIRQVQVSDAFHQAVGAQSVGSPARVRGCPPPDADVVLAATDVGAESPPETVMRLLLADLAAGCRSQLPVWGSDGSLLTVVDLGWEEPKVSVFYDGEHHLSRDQRDHDSRVLAALQKDGGRVFRVTAGMVRGADAAAELRASVAEALRGRR